MKKYIALFSFLFLFIGSLTSQLFAQDGMVITQSAYAIQETTDRLEKVLTDNGLTIFERVNHQEGATSVNLELRPGTVLIFGNPKLGTPLMQCAPTVGIDLPQKMLIWEGENGTVQVGYNSPEYLKKRHDIEGCDQELNKISKALNKFVQTATRSH